MNPAGYKDGMSTYETKTLREVNRAKNIVAPLLNNLESELKSNLTGETAAKALYNLLENVDASAGIRTKAKKLREAGDDDAAQKITELWDVIINAIDQLYLVCGDEKLEPAVLHSRLELLFGAYSVGSVPVSCDSVVIGNAALYKGGNPKAVILLGVNDGIFPASPSPKGVFDRNELAELERKGICLEDGFDRQLENEKLFFYSAAALPSEKLICIYSEGESRPSVGAVRLMKLFPGAVKSKYGENAADTVFSPASARENCRLADEGAKKLLKEKGLDDIETVREHPLSDSGAVIRNANTGSVFLSPISLEKYTYCGFSYFGRYVLKLADNRKADFSYPEIGTFVHKALEIFVSSRVSEGKFSMPTDDEIAASVDNLLSRRGDASRWAAMAWIAGGICARNTAL
jgi:ATP-dependent helicase/nuclease subunit B